MTNQTKANHLKHLIDTTLTKVNRLFVLSFENEEGRTSFSKYFVPKVEKSEEKTFEFSQNSVSIIQNGNTKNHKPVK